MVGLLATLAAGACLVLDRRFSRRGFWPLIEQRQITWINAVPAIITVLAMDPPAVRPAGAAGQIRFVRPASDPLPPSALRRFEEAELEEELREACEAALARPKRPSVFCLVPVLPVGPTGKVARRRLRELAMAGR